MIPQPVLLDNDFEHDWVGTRKNTGTRQIEPAAGLLGLQVWFSLSWGGPEIHADLIQSAIERAAAPGAYWAVTEGVALRTHLEAYIGQIIYEVFGDGVNIYRVNPCIVVAP